MVASLLLVLLLPVISISKTQNPYSVPGDYHTRPKTSKLLSQITSVLGQAQTDVIVTTSYTLWCSTPTANTTAMLEHLRQIWYWAKRSNLQKAAIGYAVLNDCWDLNTFAPTYTVDKNYVKFYQSLQLVWAAYTGQLDLDTDTDLDHWLSSSPLILQAATTSRLCSITGQLP
jgi:hypothetical protein